MHSVLTGASPSATVAVMAGEGRSPRSREAALLERIAAEPDGDAPRLIYADWLSERGDARGELITVQCLLRQAEREHRQPAADIVAREAELLEAHLDRWLTDMPLAVKRELERGFLVEVSGGSSRPLQGARLVELLEASVCMLRQLSVVYQEITANDIEQLATSPRSRSLRSLVLSGNKIGDQAVAALARSPHLCALERLELHSIGMSVEGARALAGARFERLRALDVGRNAIGDAGAALLEQSSWWAGVRTLKIDHIDIVGSGAALFGLDGLEAADLSGNPLGVSGVVGLAARGRMPKRLNLAFCKIGLDGLNELIEQGALEGIEELDLAGNELGDAGVVALAKAEGLGRLRDLQLSYNEIGDAGIAALCEAASRLPALRDLNVRRNNIQLDGARALCRCGFADQLERLNTEYNDEMGGEALDLLFEVYGDRAF